MLEQRIYHSRLIIFTVIISLLISTLGTTSANFSGDEDNDGIGNDIDKCGDNNENWSSNFSTDYDSDGCKDSTEDWDDDNDEISDEDDLCPKSIVKGWKTYMKDANGNYLDFDHDGCLDSTSEDTDDDNDGIEDQNDQCSSTPLGATVDNSGCQTSFDDADNDGVADSYDECDQTPQNSEVYWNGCLLEDELVDSDNDGVIDYHDICQDGRNNWQSNTSSDHDGDGCQDDTEDWDDDNDGVSDEYDNCNKGISMWSTYQFNPILDNDHDGCRDVDEDNDDDNDGINDQNDQCPTNRRGAEVNSAGCEISFPDLDNDSVADSVDFCDETPEGLDVGLSGCPVWEDQDNDGVPDWEDDCADTIEGSEVDNFGCVILPDSDGDGVADQYDDCPNTTTGTSVGEDGCLIQTNGGDDSGNSDITIGESDEDWWDEIPVLGEIIDKVESKYGKIIGASIFILGFIGYAYRAATLRSDFKMNRRVKKFKLKIENAKSEKELRRIQVEIETADDKRLLPRGALGDLLSLIELKAEDLGLTDFISQDSIQSSISSSDLEEGVTALREAKDELKGAMEEINNSKRSRKRSIGSVNKSSKQTSQFTLKGTGKTSISRPSYHPKDINRDGVVDEEDERIWQEMSDEERLERSSLPFGKKSNVADEILSFSKLPSSPKARCHCGKKKAYGKCCMKTDLCPCGNGKKFIKCCAKERNYL
tara:strand:+ start:1140 stop:3254 length:2115 start_codon:yes stop_codon:yes gene_type:complete